MGNVRRGNRCILGAKINSVIRAWVRIRPPSGCLVRVVTIRKSDRENRNGYVGWMGSGFVTCTLSQIFESSEDISGVLEYFHQKTVRGVGRLYPLLDT